MDVARQSAFPLVVVWQRPPLGELAASEPRHRQVPYASGYLEDIAQVLGPPVVVGVTVLQQILELFGALGTCVSGVQQLSVRLFHSFAYRRVEGTLVYSVRLSSDVFVAPAHASQQSVAVRFDQDSGCAHLTSVMFKGRSHVG